MERGRGEKKTKGLHSKGRYETVRRKKVSRSGLTSTPSVRAKKERKGTVTVW